jgi:hypothetical protein
MSRHHLRMLILDARVPYCEFRPGAPHRDVLTILR